MYSKGDTIKFADGSIGLILNNGMEGSDFSVKYLGQQLTLMSDNQVFAGVRIHLETGSRWSAPIHKNNVWYNILVGDQNAWITCATICFKITGKTPVTYP